MTRPIEPLGAETESGAHCSPIEVLQPSAVGHVEVEKVEQQLNVRLQNELLKDDQRLGVMGGQGGGPPHRSLEDDEEVVLRQGVLLEVRLQVVGQLVAVAVLVDEVNEETGAHVRLQQGDGVLVDGGVVAHQQADVLEEAAAADLLGVLRDDQPVVQVDQRLGEVAVHALADHCWVEVGGDGQRLPLSGQRDDA